MPATSLRAMHRALEPEHRAFADSVRQFVAREVDGTSVSAAGPSPELWRRAGEFGLLGLGVGEEFGGAGVDDPRFVLVLADEAMRAGATGFGLAVVTHNLVAASALAVVDDEAQRGAWLSDLACGERRLAVAGLDAPLQARRDGAALVLDGCSRGVVGAVVADAFLVVADTEEGPAAVVVPAGTAGVVVDHESAELLGGCGAGIADVHLDAVVIPASEAVLVGDSTVVDALRTHAWLAFGMLGVAGARIALQTAVKYVGERTVFGQPLSGFENTRYALTDVAVRVASTQALLDACVAEDADGSLSAARAAMVALAATEAHCCAVDAALQLHGGYGYMREYPIAQMFADARELRLLASAEVGDRRVIAESVGLVLGVS
jgi:acyl-CoA dehydrogenase